MNINGNVFRSREIYFADGSVLYDRTICIKDHFVMVTSDNRLDEHTTVDVYHGSQIVKIVDVEAVGLKKAQKVQY